MKKYFAIFTLCIMSILFTSCWGFEEVDMGYPQSVNFTKDGGEKIVTTDKSKTFISASVIDYHTAHERMMRTDEDGTGYCELEWLRVEYQSYPAQNEELKIIAQPNPNNEPRTLWIELHSGSKEHIIKVEQE